MNKGPFNKKIFFSISVTFPNFLPHIFSFVRSRYVDVHEIKRLRSIRVENSPLIAFIAVKARIKSHTLFNLVVNEILFHLKNHKKKAGNKNMWVYLNHFFCFWFSTWYLVRSIVDFYLISAVSLSISVSFSAILLYLDWIYCCFSFSHSFLRLYSMFCFLSSSFKLIILYALLISWLMNIFSNRSRYFLCTSPLTGFIFWIFSISLLILELSVSISWSYFLREFSSSSSLFFWTSYSE